MVTADGCRNLNDRNLNGKYNCGEGGIGGVMVSNRREVVLTDGRGRYRLPALSVEEAAAGMGILSPSPRAMKFHRSG